MSVRAIDYPAGGGLALLPVWAANLTLGLQLTVAVLGLLLVLVRLAVAVGDWRRQNPDTPLCSRAAVRTFFENLRHKKG
ncbi:hypothetical protein GBZ26_04085 [Azospirillum formosense]|uniref:Type IV secretion system protein VirB3 n=1 Tax=Azospirillum formosense TaxID=861533 RepID=A0ABX2KUA8_9PROT|nr:hypothetical protein [Azospirillum formosense]MBY3755721.1 hypothetical protein [Azospirillum formosense]NUB18404.1 hypothetical protein [Azospirillum formosense]